MGKRENKPADARLQSRTRAHYDRFPFDFLSEEDERCIEQLQPRPFRRFVGTHLGSEALVAEVGCGPGRATMFMEARGIEVVAVDLSENSLHLARRRAPNCSYVKATNILLPFADGTFDAVVSDGVIHHTANPRRSFAENARILRRRGVMYLAVYRRRRYYYYFYTYLGRPVRWLGKSSLGRLLVHATLLPVYYLVHQFKSRGRRTWGGAKNLFHDYILTPQATFHTREEIIDWGNAERLTLLEYEQNVGNVHAFIFEKEG